jgi:hypothetical protein
VNRKVKAFVDIQCGELHCIDTGKGFHERCDYLPYLSIETLIDKNANARCALFDEPLKEEKDSNNFQNFIRCNACMKGEK